MYILPIYFVILYNTTGISHLNFINTSGGCIHKYEQVVFDYILHIYFVLGGMYTTYCYPSTCSS
jgi:hypothetical protein